MHRTSRHSNRRLTWPGRLGAFLVFGVLAAATLTLNQASSAVDLKQANEVVATDHSETATAASSWVRSNDQVWDRQGRHGWLLDRWKRKWHRKRAQAIRQAMLQHQAKTPSPTPTPTNETVVVTGTNAKPAISSTPSTIAPATPSPIASTTPSIVTSTVPEKPSSAPAVADTPTVKPANPAPQTSPSDESLQQEPDKDAPSNNNPPTEPVEVPASPPVADQPVVRPQSVDTDWRVTVGTENKTSFDNSEAAGAGSAHGTRIYCTVSHFSHDDPIVFRDQPGAAHAHMFWGNTQTDASSTGVSVAEVGGSTCEGGTNNRSAYWTPVLFNAAGEAVLPESIVVYYKSFFRPDIGDRSTIQAIPNGLELLATSRVAGAGDWHFGVESGGANVSLDVTFPNCLQVDGSGNPVLSSTDNTSHTYYAKEQTASNCPASHPYRIPSVIYRLSYNVDANSAWSLSSDSSGPKGHSLHADYIAGWDAAVMDSLVECTIVERRNCGFEGGGVQLPERFNTPKGERIYDYSVRLTDAADRTPFGTEIGDHQ